VQKFDSARTREWLNSLVDIKEGTSQAIGIRPYAAVVNAAVVRGKKSNPAIQETSAMK